MAQELIIDPSMTKRERYEELFSQIQALVDGETNMIANLSNIMSAIKYGMDLLWVGCYFVKGDELVLGPFQGPVACTRIQKGKGVCGMAWAEQHTVIVDDVDRFPGHIACNSASRSEIVVPVIDGKGNVRMVLDVDSDRLGFFDKVDEESLQKVAKLIEGML